MRVSPQGAPTQPCKEKSGKNKVLEGYLPQPPAQNRTGLISSPRAFSNQPLMISKDGDYISYISFLCNLLQHFTALSACLGSILFPPYTQAWFPCCDLCPVPSTLSACSSENALALPLPKHCFRKPKTNRSQLFSKHHSDCSQLPWLLLLAKGQTSLKRSVFHGP